MSPLTPNGFDVAGGSVQSVVTFVLPGDVDDPAVASGGNVYGRRMCDLLGGRKIAIPGAWPMGDPSVLAAALARLPDGAVVVLDGLVGCAWPEVVGPEARRLRLAVIVHLPLGDEAGLEPTHAAKLNTREWATLHAVGAIVATSQWSASRLVEHHGLDSDRVHVVMPGTDRAPLATGTDGRSRLLCVAAVTPHKGQDLLVEALAVLETLPWRCECVGPLLRNPAYVDHVRELIEARGLTGRVTIAGPRAGAALEDTYAAADLVVLPSRTETYGMVVAEALMRGIPVLGSAAGAIPDTLGRAPDGTVPGVLVPPRDPEALADALRRWLTEPDLPATLRASARGRRETLRGWTAAARELARVLDRMEAAWVA